MRLCCSVVALLTTLVRMREVQAICDYVPCISGAPHSMCIYPATLDTSAPHCNGPLALAGMEDRVRREILHQHNLLRQKVALGKVKGQPPAADMMKLQWNAELEMIAQRFANECGKDGLVDDQCRDMKDGTPAGQNPYLGNITIRHALVQDKGPYIIKMMKTWFDEVKFLNHSLIHHYNGSMAAQVYHYTQLVWAETSMLGCGAVLENRVSAALQPMAVKCNYAPTGNVEDHQVYQQGKACTKCPRGTHCSTQYQGLCTNEAAEVPAQAPAAATTTTTTTTTTTNLVCYCLVMSVLYKYNL